VCEVREALVHDAVEVAEGARERVGGHGSEAEFVGDAEDMSWALREGAAERIDVSEGIFGVACREDP
jgi:hypothetical protein